MRLLRVKETKSGGIAPSWEPPALSQPTQKGYGLKLSSECLPGSRAEQASVTTILTWIKLDTTHMASLLSCPGSHNSPR